MEQRNIGRSGLRAWLLGLGCTNFGPRSNLEATKRVVHRVVEVGGTSSTLPASTATASRKKYQLSLLPCRPIAGGYLTGKSTHNEPIPEGARPVAFGGRASKPFIPSVIAGASTPEQVDLNWKVGTCGLSAEEVAA